MSYQDYKAALKEHPRYAAPREATPRGVKLHWYQRRAVWLGAGNIALLVAMMVLGLGMAGVLWMIWGEALALTSWMVIKKGMQRFWWAVGSLAFLLYAFTQLLGIATIEAQANLQAETAIYTSAAIAAVLAVAVLLPAHAAPPVARFTSVWPQLSLVLGALVAGGAFFFFVGPSEGLPLMLLIFKAMSQTALATHRELKAMERVPKQAIANAGTASKPAAVTAPAKPAAAKPTMQVQENGQPFVMPDDPEEAKRNTSFQRVSDVES